MQHNVVSRDAWLAARLELLQKEKKFTRLRDQLTRERLQLPWTRIEKEYFFDAPEGQVSLADLFGGCSQLLVYHFMFESDWSEGCKACSLLADHYEPLAIHLLHRDVSLITVARAPLAMLGEFQCRMDWDFKWVSSQGSDFNRDFQVTCTAEEIAAGQAYYNYQTGARPPATECPGISAFYKDEQGNVFHSYSSYGRGLEDFLGIYRFLDIVPKGRDEEQLPYGMAWIRLKDQYDDESIVDPYV